MKISTDRYNEIKNGISRLIDEYHKASIEPGSMWELFNHVSFDFMYDDNHPAYRAGRKRINPHKEGWNIYKDDLNDKHIETALMKIGRELGII